MDTILVSLCPSEFNTKLWYPFKYVASQLARLERKGFQIEVKGKTQTIYARLIALSGDNLFCHYAYGLNNCFSSGKCCRFCTIDVQAVRNFMYYDNSDPDRNRAKFQEKELDIPTDRSAGKFTISDRLGVKRRHLFDFEFYKTDINKIQMVDCFHDTLQGVLGYLIQFFVENLNIPGDEGPKHKRLNKIVKSFYFKYGCLRFKEKLDVSGTGYQKLEFFQV